MFTNMLDGSAAQVATADGRRLAYLDVGDPDGPLVIHNHGGPSKGGDIFDMVAEDLGA